MIPTRYDYYKRRAHEHRSLAGKSRDADERSMHDQLVGAYMGLARKYRLRQTVTIKVA